MSVCKSCGAEIIWIETPDGRKCPVQREQINVWTHDGLTEQWRLVKAHEPHFATCPDADKWRKKKDGDE